MKARIWLTALLVLLGAGWGLTQPLSKIAVSSGHGPLGLIFWQLAIGAVVLGLVNMVRKKALPVSPDAIKWYLFLAIAGTLLPNTTSFISFAHLPSGIMSIVIAMVPLFAFPIALMMGNDRFGWVRLLGVIVGLLGVVILSRPGASIPAGTVGFLALALVAPFLYAIEANVVARWGAGGLDPVTLLLGASILGAVLALPLAVGSGQWIDPLAGMAAPEWALVGSSVIHAFVYSSYVWLVGRAGATFAAQVSYLVTGFGVVWAMLILGESYSGWVWLALGLMFSGLFLVQPHKKE